MRKAILTISLMAITSHNAWSGFPVFHGDDSKQGSSKPTVSSPKSSGNWMTRLWKSDKRADPQFFYNPPTTPPTTSERITSAITDNAAIRTARNWMPSGENAAPKEIDTISLQRPVGAPTPDLLLSMAQIRESNSDSEGARDLYLKALAADPKNAQTLREFGHFEDRQSRLIEAERYYTQAVQIEPQNSAAQNDLALCLARQEKFGHAAQVLDRAIALQPTKPLYRNNMATVLMQLGEQHLAMQHLLSVHPPAAAYYNMGHLLEQQKQPTAAQAHYAEALRLDPAIKPAERAIARLSSSVADTTPAISGAAAKNASLNSDSTAWPSSPITPQASPSSRSEPEFGPQLLPPVP